eukprot:jgi/Bigna1/143109/aug1.75_g17817
MGCGLASHTSIEVTCNLEVGSDGAVVETPRFVTAVEVVEWANKRHKVENFDIKRGSDVNTSTVKEVKSCGIVKVQFKYLCGKGWTAMSDDTDDSDEWGRHRKDRSFEVTFGPGEYTRELNCVSLKKGSDRYRGMFMLKFLSLTTNLRQKYFGDEAIAKLLLSKDKLAQDGKTLWDTYTADEGQMVIGLKFDETQERVIGIQTAPISEYVKQFKFQRPVEDGKALGKEFADCKLCCPKGHRLIFTSYVLGGYEEGIFTCNVCKKERACQEGRWWCNQCYHDVCYHCRPEEKEREDDVENGDLIAFCPRGCRMEYTNSRDTHDGAPWSCSVCGDNEKHAGYTGWRFHCKEHKIDYCFDCKPVENKPGDTNVCTCAECGHKCVYKTKIDDPYTCAGCKGEFEDCGGYVCNFLWPDKMCRTKYCFDCIPDAKSCPEPTKQVIKGLDPDRHKAIIDPRATEEVSESLNMLSYHGGVLRLVKIEHKENVWERDRETDFAFDCKGGSGKDADWRVKWSGKGLSLTNRAAKKAGTPSICEDYCLKLKKKGKKNNRNRPMPESCWQVEEPPCGKDCFQLMMVDRDAGCSNFDFEVYLACDSDGKLCTHKVYLNGPDEADEEYPECRYDVNTLFRFALLK